MSGVQNAGIDARRHPVGSGVTVRPVGTGCALLTVHVVGPRGGAKAVSVLLEPGEVADLIEALGGAS